MLIYCNRLSTGGGREGGRGRGREGGRGRGREGKGERSKRGGGRNEKGKMEAMLTCENHVL